ncbi:MAG: hypothetical protein GX549_05375 [Clostridiales bacterium]|nr:hypothetical protein [Clostridiales bacterium]
MNRAIKGMVLGSIVGMAATAMVVNRMQPSLGRSLMKQGRSWVRRYRRRLLNMGMY